MRLANRKVLENLAYFQYRTMSEAISADLDIGFFAFH